MTISTLATMARTTWIMAASRIKIVHWRDIYRQNGVALRQTVPNAVTTTQH